MAQMLSLPSLRMRYRARGADPSGERTVVLLHGWPQTSACWDDLVPLLETDHRLIAPDLRGYGLSDKPSHGYSKRRMAADIVELIDELGIERPHLVGHDRGARVAHRFALDHGDRLRTLTVLDIMPTHAMFSADVSTAAGFFHWLFHMQPDLPELLTTGAEETYLRYFFERWTFRRDVLEPKIAMYVRAFTQPGAMRAGFDDYRATWEDLAEDAHDQSRGNRVMVPTLALWGTHGLVAGAPVVEQWRAYVAETDRHGENLLRGRAMEQCGHFLPEEQPAALARELGEFWDGH